MEVPISIVAYMAGIIDGDGSITISLSKHVHYNMQLSVGSVEPKLTDFLYKHFGGLVAVQRRPTKDFYFIRWNSSKAAEIIRLILPYLVIKKDIAEVAIAFQDLRESREKNSHLAEWELQVMELLRSSLKSKLIRGGLHGR